MSPLITTGSIIVVQKKDWYNPRDVISFYSQVDGKETIITHRLYRMGGNVYVTKGDANSVIDEHIVVPRLIIGKVICIIPYLGYVVSFAKGRIGLWTTIIIPALLIIFFETQKAVRIFLEENITSESK